MKFTISLLLCIHFSLYGANFDHLTNTIQVADTQSLFPYDLEIQAIKGKSDDEPVMICFHGYGSDKRVGRVVSSYPEISEHVVSFNFPDYQIQPNTRDPHKTAFGSIDELLPALYALKKCVVDAGVDRVSLYGFSAGGGAVVNTIAVLNTERFDSSLSKVGITSTDKRAILEAIQKGDVILDCPLKSIDEIIAFRGHNREFDILRGRYRQNDLRPIDSLKHFENLSLNILVHFQVGDKALSNRDDDLFIQRLRLYNALGNTCAVTGNDGGHLSYHASLWKIYPEFRSEKCRNKCIQFN